MDFLSRPRENVQALAADLARLLPPTVLHDPGFGQCIHASLTVDTHGKFEQIYQQLIREKYVQEISNHEFFLLPVGGDSIPKFCIVVLNTPLAHSLTVRVAPSICDLTQ